MERLIVAALAAQILACSSPTPTPAADTAVADAGATDTGQVADTAAKRTQYYAAKLTFHGAPFDGKVVELDRDLTQIDSVLIYGNTHLTPPAVAFGMQDHVPQPATTQKGQPTIIPLDFQLRFGILVEAVGFPVNTGKAGTYPFGCTSPMVQVNFDMYSYRSTCPGNDGQFEIEKWAASPGGKFSGTVKGRAAAYIFQSSAVDDCKAENTAQTCKVKDKWVDVEAEFDFLVPALNSNSAPDAWP